MVGVKYVLSQSIYMTITKLNVLLYIKLHFYLEIHHSASNDVMRFKLISPYSVDNMHQVKHNDTANLYLPLTFVQSMPAVMIISNINTCVSNFYPLYTA